MIQTINDSVWLESRQIHGIYRVKLTYPGKKWMCEIRKEDPFQGWQYNLHVWVEGGAINYIENTVGRGGLEESHWFLVPSSTC